ncbi:unnamed protein product, partial [Ilex paraguariensis]
TFFILYLELGEEREVLGNWALWGGRLRGAGHMRLRGAGRMRLRSARRLTGAGHLVERLRDVGRLG